MNTLLHHVLEQKTVVTPDGQKQELHSGIDREEARFLQALIKRYNVTRTLEVGCAMGISSLAICEAIAENSATSHHIIIDPYQRSEWKSIGLHHLAQAGYQNFRLIEEPSEFALPKLAEEKTPVELAFIDGWHTFDHTLVDFFYINRLLRPGGILVVDDVRMPSVRRVMRMIHTYPCYRMVGHVLAHYSTKGKAVELLKNVLRPFSKLVGSRLAAEMIDASVVRSDRSLGLNSSVIAFEKIEEDRRPWNWYENF
ncbi:class I SAM-dependent methyltransferase [Flavisolibacter sp. BT320]|nr:class I SAM-dependent methyltransferase [Flavisolibacter longurius]